MAIAAQAFQESEFNHNARSSRGAVGIMQMLPSTAASKAVNIPNIEPLENNIHAGVKYLAWIRDRYFSAPEISRKADAYIEKQGALNGLMIVAEKFPGWEDVQGFVAHIQFVRDHHKKIKKVAFVSDSKFFEFVPRLAEHFVNAEVKHFDSVDKQFALEWLSA